VDGFAGAGGGGQAGATPLCRDDTDTIPNTTPGDMCTRTRYTDANTPTSHA
jgi:hypothetical protein